MFSHGMNTGPWGTKIAALAETARGVGAVADSIDYRDINDVQQRNAMLLAAGSQLRGELVMVGSSLGAYSALVTARALHALGVFLMAPALYDERLPPLAAKVADCPVVIVHGLHDELIPAEHSMRYAREQGATLHVVDSDHRLHDQVPFLKYLFEYFLIGLDKSRMRH
jgi:pimeloyl-ACP methyl ester carboxylesterase